MSDCFNPNLINPRESDEDQRKKINENLQSIKDCVGSGNLIFNRVSPPSAPQTDSGLTNYIELSESDSGDIQTAGTSSGRKALLMALPIYHEATVNTVILAADYDGSNDNYFFDLFAWELDPETETFTSEDRMHLVDNGELTDSGSKSLSNVSALGGLAYDLQSQFTFEPGIWILGLVFHSRVDNSGGAGTDGNSALPALPGASDLVMPQYHTGYVDDIALSDLDGGNDTYKIFFNSQDFGSTDGDFDNSYSVSRDGAEFGYFPYLELINTETSLVQWDANYTCSYDLGVGEVKLTGEVCSSPSGGQVRYLIECGDKQSFGPVQSFSSANNNCTEYPETIPIQSTPPSNPSADDRYINEDTNELYKYDGSSWNLEFTLSDTCETYAHFRLNSGQDEWYGPCNPFGFIGGGGSSGEDDGGATAGPGTAT